MRASKTRAGYAESYGVDVARLRWIKARPDWLLHWVFRAIYYTMPKAARPSWLGQKLLYIWASLEARAIIRTASITEAELEARWS